MATEDNILYEDAHLLVLNKPSGLMVERDRAANPSVESWVEDYLKSTSKSKEVFVGIVHRLDRPVSGVLLVAKKKSALKNLNEQFQKRTVKKIYRAVTEKRPLESQGILKHWLFKDTIQKKAFILDTEKASYDPVALSYRIIGDGENNYLWHIDLLTGKYHQIRAQLAFIGCPIIGDSLYGSQQKFKEGAIALHAFSLSFKHPVTDKVMTIEAPFLNTTNN